jgi:fructokinase
MRILCLGEVLWDLFGQEERFGGAALNFCTNLHRLGNEATLLSAVGQDNRGALALDRMRAVGLNTRYIQQVEHLPTGTAVVETGEDGEPHFLIPRPAAFDRVADSPQLERDVQEGRVDWLYFGTLMQTTGSVEALTAHLAGQMPKPRCFYDMNLRTGQWNLPLVQRLSALATVLKLNEAEAATLHAEVNLQGTPFVLEEFCRAWSAKYAIEAICVTLGPEGCFVYDKGVTERVAGFKIQVADTVGAGDAFGAAFLHGYERGWSIPRMARFANALGAIVASRPGATPEWTLAECLELVESAG